MSDFIEGKIAALLDKTSVVINRGTDHNVEAGDTFYIYSQIGPFSDPDTGDDLGTTTKVWGKVEVTIVEDRFCVARTEYQGGFYAPTLRRLFGGRVELPVNEGELTRLPQTVAVGFTVRSVRREVREIEAGAEALPATSDSDEETDTSETVDATDYAEGFLEEMGAAFKARYGGNYALIGEEAQITYILSGDSSQLSDHKGQKVGVWGSMEKVPNRELQTFQVTDISPL